ncbi:MAG: VWA domain-containing protein [Rhodobacteraceae bacterium]|nr:VWA domain-containing protein [Paracoccaceae bacterium]
MSQKSKQRWRLLLGRYAQRHLGELSGDAAARDAALDYLYGREYQKRGLHQGRGAGSLDPTQMRALDWLGEANRLFPKSVFEALQTHALDKYGITDLLDDPKTLEALEPNKNLLKALLSFHGRAKPEVRDKLRAVADEVIRDIMQKLKSDVQRAFSGRRNRFKRSHIQSAANFDWRATLRSNLKTYDPERGRIIAEDLRFNARERRRLPWHVILCVDQSGSMTDSIIHSAIMATILSGLPGVSVSMVLFDTSVVDVTDSLSDPLETLLSVQLGGGTDIGRAVEYCEGLVTMPERTVFVLISDFAEGAAPRRLFSAVARLAEARVKLLGLGALDMDGAPYIDQKIADRLSTIGMKIATMTPDRLASWLAGVIQ